VVLETNASLIDDTRALELKESGLHAATVNLPDWGEAFDAITRVPGGFQATLRGLLALTSAGIPVTVSVPLIRSNAGSVAQLPAALRRALPSLGEARRLIVTIPEDTPDPSEVLLPNEANSILSEFRTQANIAGFDVQLGADSSTIHQALTPEFRDEFISLCDVIAPSGEMVRTAELRITLKCNQNCRFCFVSLASAEVASDIVSRAIALHTAAGHRILFTGGEPTLHQNLLTFVAQAKALSPWPVLLQTNAVLMAGSDLSRKLVDAGLGHALVSLHASDAKLSDSITGVPGTFDLTVRGIDQLVAARIPVAIVVVACRSNFMDLEDCVQMVARRWPGISICIAAAGPSTSRARRDPAIVVSYSELSGPLANALSAARDLGVSITGQESMCSIPACQLPSWYVDKLPEFRLDHELAKGEFVKRPVCAQCHRTHACWGFRRGYVEQFGDREFPGP
jgi:MoaA/NifB/PqqE/SkfB family radical SAM enzyme